MADNYEPQDLGRVTPIYQGAYDAARTYELNDVVTFEGNLYWHTRAAATTGIAPDDTPGEGETNPWTIAFSGSGLSADMEAQVRAAEGHALNAQSYAEGQDTDGDGIIDIDGAKQYAGQAHAHESAAGIARQYAEGARDAALQAKQGAETAESEALVHEANARKWAEGYPTEPEDGKSAKTWAEEAAETAEGIEAERTQIETNRKDIAELSGTVAANKTATDTALAELNSIGHVVDSAYFEAPGGALQAVADTFVLDGNLILLDHLIVGKQILPDGNYNNNEGYSVTDYFTQTSHPAKWELFGQKSHV